MVLVVCGDRAMQESLRDIVVDAGCRMIAVCDVAAAAERLTRVRVVLALVDPLLVAACTSLAAHCHVVAIPVRTSSNGVRRISKRAESARWLREIVTQRCRVGG